MVRGVDLRLVAEIGGLPESRHSRDGTRAPGQAAVFCSVSPTVDLTTVDGSSFTYGAPSNRQGTKGASP